MNYTDGGDWVHTNDVTETESYSTRELILKIWFGLAVILSAIGLGLTLWGTVYHPAGYGGNTSRIDSRTVIAGLLCLAFGALALSIFCWYTKCCNTNGLPDCPANGASSYDDDVPKHIPPPVPGLLITQTFGPVQPGTISNLTPPQIHKLASTPTDEFPPPSMLTPRVSFSGQLPRSPRGSFSGTLPQSPKQRISGPVQSLPGLGSINSSNRMTGPVHSSPRLSASACLNLRSPVKPGTISNLTPPQIHKLATTPTDDPYKQFQGVSKSKEKYLTPGYQHQHGHTPSIRRGHSPVPFASGEDTLSSSHSRRSSYCSIKGEPT